MPKRGWNDGQWPKDRLKKRLLERLERRSVWTESGCREWSGARDRQGYGFTSFGTYKKTMRAHRAAYALHHGLPMDFDGVVCHRCDNPPCCNPEHLFLGTVADNAKDKVAKGRQTRGEAHHVGGKLTAEKVRKIRSDNRSQTKIAADYGISQGTVRDVKHRRTWAHVL